MNDRTAFTITDQPGCIENVLYNYVDHKSEFCRSKMFCSRSFANTFCASYNCKKVSRQLQVPKKNCIEIKAYLGRRK